MTFSNNLFTLRRLIFSVALVFSFSTFSFAEAEPPLPEALEELIQEGLAHEPEGSLDFEDEPIKEISYWKEFFRMMMILGIILGVVLVLAWFLRGFLNKRVKQVNESNIIKVVERRNLSQKSMLYLVQVYQKQFLIGDSATGGVEYLKECTPEEVETPEEPDFETKGAKTTFMEILQRKLTDKHTNLFKQKK